MKTVQESIPLSTNTEKTLARTGQRASLGGMDCWSRQASGAHAPILQDIDLGALASDIVAIKCSCQWALTDWYNFSLLVALTLTSSLIRVISIFCVCVWVVQVVVYHPMVWMPHVIWHLKVTCCLMHPSRYGTATRLVHSLGLYERALCPLGFLVHLS